MDPTLVIFVDNLWVSLIFFIFLMISVVFLSLLSTLHDQEVAPAIGFLADPRIFFSCLHILFFQNSYATSPIEVILLWFPSVSFWFQNTKKHPVSLKSFQVLIHTKKGDFFFFLRTTFCVLSVNLHCETLPLGL